jgi:hypothetical protein
MNIKFHEGEQRTYIRIHIARRSDGARLSVFWETKQQQPSKVVQLS